MFRRRLAATAVLALALAGSAACAQPTAGSPNPGPKPAAPAAPGNNAAFCAALADTQGPFADSLSGMSDTTEPAQLTIAGDRIEQLARLAPPEIAADLQSVADGFHAGAAGVAGDEVGARITQAFVRVSQQLPRICP